MDREVIVVLIVSLMLIGIFVATVIDANAHQIAMGKAMNICQEHGYDFADRINRTTFSEEPLGIKCGFIDYSQKYINIKDINNYAVLVN